MSRNRKQTLKQKIGKKVQEHLPFSPRITGILRFEFAVARQRWANRVLP